MMLPDTTLLKGTTMFTTSFRKIIVPGFAALALAAALPLSVSVFSGVAYAGTHDASHSRDHAGKDHSGKNDNSVKDKNSIKDASGTDGSGKDNSGRDSSKDSRADSGLDG